MYFVYVIKNTENKLYKGYTSNLTKRLHEHNFGGKHNAYTKGKGPWTLVYFERVENKKEALIREKFLKSGQGREYINTRIQKHSPEESAGGGSVQI